MMMLHRSINQPYAVPVAGHAHTWRDPKRLFHLGLLTGVVLMTYYGMWRAYFATLDDFGITGWVRHQPTLWTALQGYGSGVRFFNYLPIRLKTEWFALEAGPYLWSSLIQYLCLTWLVYLLAHWLLQGGRRALLAALFFATTYAHYEVVTYVSASDYTLWATLYLTILLLFARYLYGRKPIFYGAALVGYLVLAFAHDFTLSLPLVLVAYHLTSGRGMRPLTALRWPDLWLHLPFWAIWLIHVGLQVQLMFAGTSEAVYSDNLYTPGLHMLTNLRYLIFLLFPNTTIAPIQNFLTTHLSLTSIANLWTLSMLLGTLLQGVLLWCVWRGKPVVQFAVALIYLPFLQYTPWHGHFIEAPRYLLLPSVGIALLLALLIPTLFKWATQQRAHAVAILLSAVIVLYAIANVGIIQVWIEQHIENGYFRRTFVTALTTNYAHITRNDVIWIEVPKAKFLDLEAACRLVYPYYVPCKAFTTDALPASQPVPTAGVFYWLRATDAGIEQVKPPKYVSQP